MAQTSTPGCLRQDLGLVLPAAAAQAGAVDGLPAQAQCPARVASAPILTGPGRFRVPGPGRRHPLLVEATDIAPGRPRTRLGPGPAPLRAAAEMGGPVDAATTVMTTDAEARVGVATRATTAAAAAQVATENGVAGSFCIRNEWCAGRMELVGCLFACYLPFFSPTIVKTFWLAFTGRDYQKKGRNQIRGFVWRH